MDNNQVFFALGKLTAEVHALRIEHASVRADINKLITSDTLARGGKKMLIKVGTLCSALGGGLVAGLEFTIKYFS